MAKHVKVYSPAGGNPTVEISVEQLEGGCQKQLTKHFDSDGAVNWTDDNRYFEFYTVTGIVSKANLAVLRTAQQSAMGATYPKIDVYDKSGGGANTYSPVQIVSLGWVKVGDDEWRVTARFEW